MGAMKKLALELHMAGKCDRKTCVFCRFMGESEHKAQRRF